MKRLTDTNLVARGLAWLARAVYYHRALFLYPQLVLAALCVLYTVTHLNFDLRQDDLVGANKKYHQNFLRFKKEFPTQDDLVVVVESENPERNRQFIERLGARLEVETNLFHNVMYKNDFNMLGSKALLFVPDKDLEELKHTLGDYRPFIQQFSHTTNLASLFGMINTQFRTAKREENAENRSLMKALPTLQRIISQAHDSILRSGCPPSPGVAAFFDAADKVYINYAQGRIFLLTAQAPTEELNDAAVERLRLLVEQIRMEVPGVNVGLTGEPVLDHDQMVQSQKDAALASVVSLFLCAVIFIYGYQETGRPVKATLCLLVGLTYTLAFAFLPWPVGHLNILTITFVPILIGLAIDYGVHLISRFEEELKHGRTEEEALVKAMVFTGQGIFSGAFTTAGAFLAMYFTDFKGIQEMGIICGGGLLICFVPMMTMLPVLLLRGRQNAIDHAQGEVDRRRARIENLWLQRPGTTAAITLTLCVLAATQLPKVRFDYNLLHMQSAGLPAVVYEQKLIDSTPKSVLYAAVVATNLEHAAALERQITNLPSVESIDSMTPFLAENQKRKLELVCEIKQDLAPVSFPPADGAPVDLPKLSQTLYSLFGFLGAAGDDVQKDDPELARRLASLRQGVEDLRKEMFRGTPRDLEDHAAKLAAFQQAFFNDVRNTFQGLKDQDTSAPLRPQDLPPVLHDRFVGVTGKYLLMVNPKEDVWKREAQKTFIEQLRTVDPNVTGTPVQLYEYTNLLKDSYIDAAKYSLIAIIFLVLFHFRSLWLVILALLPVAIGSLWLGGLMGWLDIQTNPANIMTLPLVIGIGVTNGIHILNRFAEEQSPNILARSTGKAVLVSGLTTIAGFGSLALGKHQGLQSLGKVMATGLATCMIAALMLLPALLNLIYRHRISTHGAAEQKTQRRQLAVDAGSGGTEVKTSSITEV